MTDGATLPAKDFFTRYAKVRPPASGAAHTQQYVLQWLGV